MAGESLIINSDFSSIRYAIPENKLPKTTKGLVFHVVADKYNPASGNLINTADALGMNPDGGGIPDLTNSLLPTILDSPVSYPIGGSFYFTVGIAANPTRTGLQYRLNFGADFTIILKYANSSVTATNRSALTFLNSNGKSGWRIATRHSSSGNVSIIKFIGDDIFPGSGGVTSTLLSGTYPQKGSNIPDTLTMTYSREDKKLVLYSNGVKMYQVLDANLGSGDGVVYIGIAAESTSYSNDFNGVINMLSIYNRVMDDNEVSIAGV